MTALPSIVVGSGPAGVACAQALLDAGRPVRLLDAGLELEPWRAQRIGGMAATPAADWPAADRAMIREGSEASANGIPLKLAFGSDFPYKDANRELALDEAAGIGLKASLARGGLSNVWGAAMLPYSVSDLRDWPFDASRLADHYRAVVKLTGLAGARDALAQAFPLFDEHPGELPLSRQAATLLGTLERHTSTLRAAGVTFGRARLAVRARRDGEHDGCVACGTCLYGCPYGFIYNSTATLQALLRQPRFEYQPDIIVERVRETASDVTVTSRHRVSGAAVTHAGERVYLAAGVIPTTRIVLESLGAYDQPVTIQDSQYFLLPLLALRATAGVREESLHTLSQLFLELTDTAISPHTVHLQLYTYNDLIGQAARRPFGPLAGLLEPVLRRMDGRLLVVQGYLHSSQSSRIRARLVRASGGARLELTPDIDEGAAPTVRRVARKLLRLSRSIGAVPLVPMLQVAPPGRGFHSGGSLPMRRTPEAMETDVLGRPSGWQRVHIADAATFPTIPATTITFTAMANAHRIATESARLERS